VGRRAPFPAAYPESAISMKTYPVHDEEGRLIGFEISSAWVTFRPLFRILRSVSGVSNIRRCRRGDVRISFDLFGNPMQIVEPWGDNSRFLVGSVDETKRLNLAELHDVFRAYKGL